MPLAENRPGHDADGFARKAHYGAGRQPWDDIVAMGWGPAFAASCVVRYLRRTKDPEHSLESARWYYRQLYQRATLEVHGAWATTLHRLDDLLTLDELRMVRREP